MWRHPNKIIMTRRMWQLVAVMVFVVLMAFARYYPFSLEYGLRLGGSIFLVVFGLTYLREERRALSSPKSNLVLNWNLAEAVVLLSSLVGYYIVAWVLDFDHTTFYAYFHTGTLGWLSGLLIGEFVWPNTQLRHLDEAFRQRYWANYKNSIF